jgi:hypothetical protein
MGGYDEAMRGCFSVFPLYLYQEYFGQTEKVANLNKAIVQNFPPLLWRGAGRKVANFPKSGSNKEMNFSKATNIHS